MKLILNTGEPLDTEDEQAVNQAMQKSTGKEAELSKEEIEATWTDNDLEKGKKQHSDTPIAQGKRGGDIYGYDSKGNPIYTPKSKGKGKSGRPTNQELASGKKLGTDPATKGEFIEVKGVVWSVGGPGSGGAMANQGSLEEFKAKVKAGKYHKRIQFTGLAMEKEPFDPVEALMSSNKQQTKPKPKEESKKVSKVTKETLEAAPIGTSYSVEYPSGASGRIWKNKEGWSGEFHNPKDAEGHFYDFQGSSANVTAAYFRGPEHKEPVSIKVTEPKKLGKPPKRISDNTAAKLNAIFKQKGSEDNKLKHAIVSVKKNDPEYAPQRLGAAAALMDMAKRLGQAYDKGKKPSAEVLQTWADWSIKEHRLFPEWFREDLSKYTQMLSDKLDWKTKKSLFNELDGFLEKALPKDPEEEEKQEIEKEKQRDEKPPPLPPFKVKKSEDAMSGKEVLEEFAKARGKTPVGGVTEAGYTVKEQGGKRTYVKEGEKKDKQALSEDDEANADELKLYLDNDSDLYRQREAFEANAVKKMAAGTYDSAKAPDLWKYLAERASKKYMKEFGKDHDFSFPPKVRKEVGKQLAKEFEQMVMENPKDYEKHVPKKYKKDWEAKTKLDDRQIYEAINKQKVAGTDMTAGELTSKEGGEGPWEVDSKGDHWYIINKKTGASKKVGRVGGPQGKGRGTNYYDKAKEIAKERNKRIKKSMPQLTPMDLWAMQQEDPGLSDESLEKAYNGEFDEVEEDMSEPIEDGAEVLNDFLEKAQSMPEGPPKQTMGVGEEQGGKLAGVGMTSGEGSGDSTKGFDADGKAKGASPDKKDKLSEDDEEDEDQMKPHKKPIETRKSLDMSVPSHQREMVAHEHAVAVSKLRKGEEPVQVGIGVASPEEEPEPVLEKGKSWNQGKGSRVVYSEQSDLEVDRLLQKSEDMYPMGAPSIGNNPAVVNQQVQCNVCKGIMAKSLAVCPHCGTGSQVPIVALYESGEGDSLEEVVQKSEVPMLQPARKESDVFAPNGLTIDEDE